jgi:hypothetical protein
VLDSLNVHQDVDQAIFITHLTPPPPIPTKLSVCQYLIIVFIRVERSVVSDKMLSFFITPASSFFAANGSETEKISLVEV